LMAERTAQSWTTVPHFFLVREVEASALLSARENLLQSKVSSAVKITTTDLLIAIVSRVLMRHPRMNASYSPDGIRLHPSVNMGIAIAVNEGVIAAVIPNAHTASITEIATQRRDLVERAKAGKSRAQDLIDATFTISNLGMFSIDSFTAIIPPSQAGILAVGTISDRVVAIDGKPAVRSMMTLTLSCDHRVVDGARGALFLDDLANAISKPQEHLGSQL
jgi:pyruvate dehydrogenase E2 component (dihydrolipoamide acetyltransferase)